MTHNQKHTAGKALLKAGSDRRSGRYVQNTKQTQETNIHAFCRVRTHYPNYRAAADLRLGPHGHRNRPVLCNMTRNQQYYLVI